MSGLIATAVLHFLVLICLIYKNDSFVLYTCLVEMHFLLVNPDHVQAIRLLTSKVKFEPWCNLTMHYDVGPCYYNFRTL